MATMNLSAGWIGILAGFLTGAIIGLFFHGDTWLGGYGSWRRRMLRLGHISFFGIGFVNLAFALTVNLLKPADPLVLPGLLLVAGAIAMPTICFLSAWRKMFRHLFVIPVVCLVLGVSIFIFRGLLP